MPRKNTKTMVFMDHIIANRQIRKALYLLALIGMLFLPRFFLHAEHIAFRDHQAEKTDIQIPYEAYRRSQGYGRDL